MGSTPGGVLRAQLACITPNCFLASVDSAGVGWTRLDPTRRDSNKLAFSRRINLPIFYLRRRSTRRCLSVFPFIIISNRRCRRPQPSPGPSLLGVLGRVAILSRAIVSTSAFGREQGRLPARFAWVPLAASHGGLYWRIYFFAERSTSRDSQVRRRWLSHRRSAGIHARRAYNYQSHHLLGRHRSQPPLVSSRPFPDWSHFLMRSCLRALLRPRRILQQESQPITPPLLLPKVRFPGSIESLHFTDQSIIATDHNRYLFTVSNLYSYSSTPMISKRVRSNSLSTHLPTLNPFSFQSAAPPPYTLQ